MPKVSVIVPVYKVEKFLDRCVESLVGQTLEDIEIILVDDGSPDECPRLCDEWANRDDRIKVVHKANGGLGFARNSGIEVATGEFIGFVDSDDYVDPKMYETLYRAATEHGAQIAMNGLCCIGGIMSAKEDSVEYINCFDEELLFEGKEGIDSLLLNIVGALPHESQDSKYGFSSVKNIYRSDVITENGILFFSERAVLSEDVMFLLSFLDHCDRAIGVPGGMYFYCRNGESLSKSFLADRFEKSVHLVDLMNGFLAVRMPEKNYRIYTDRLMQAYTRTSCTQEIQFAKKNGLDKKQLKARLRAICKSERVQSVLKNYPWTKLPIKQAVFAATMRFCLLNLQIFLVQLRENH